MHDTFYFKTGLHSTLIITMATCQLDEKLIQDKSEETDSIVRQRSERKGSKPDSEVTIIYFLVY